MKRLAPYAFVLLAGCSLFPNDDPPTEPECEERLPFYPDADGDGVGDAGTILFACEAPDGYTDNAPPGTDTADPCRSGTPTLTIGTGTTAFEPLLTGDDVPIVFGAQGGWHLTGAIRLTQVPQLVRIRYRITDDRTSSLFSDTQRNVALVPTGSDSWACDGEFLDMTGFIDVSALATDCATLGRELLDGRAITVQYDIEDIDGNPLIDGNLQLVATRTECDPTPVDTGCAADPDDPCASGDSE